MNLQFGSVKFDAGKIFDGPYSTILIGLNLTAIMEGRKELMNIAQ